MKKVILVAAKGVLALVSCKKDYTCSCTVSSSGSIFGEFTVVVDTVYQDSKKSDAEDACATRNYSASALGVTNTSVCEIK